MNTSRGLFAHRWARKAVDLAVDRPAIAALSGGVAADQYLPTALLTSPSPPPTSPTTADLARARALLRGRHANVTLLFEAYTSLYKQYANVIRDDLARIGLHVIARAVPDPYETDTRGDMRIFGWVFDSGIPRISSPSSSSRAIPLPIPTASIPLGQRADDRASQLTGAARLRAFSAVARGVHALVPWVVLDQRGVPAFFSARLGCVHFRRPMPGRTWLTASATDRWQDGSWPPAGQSRLGPDLIQLACERGRSAFRRLAGRPYRPGRGDRP